MYTNVFSFLIKHLLNGKKNEGWGGDRHWVWWAKIKIKIRRGKFLKISLI
jgi:hypothetical protein